MKQFVAFVLLACSIVVGNAQPYLTRYETLQHLLNAGKAATLAPGTGMTEGRATKNDGSGNVYYWDPLSTADTNSIVHIPTGWSGAGRWFMLIQSLNRISNGGQFDTSGDIWTLTNVTAVNAVVNNLFVTNIYAQNFYTTNFLAIYTNVYFTNFYAGDIYTTNLFVTNITEIGGSNYYSYVTNYYDNSITTNINSTIINTNVTQQFSYTTNYIDNSQIIITNTYITINGTNVATINPTIGFYPVKTGTNSFGDGAWYASGTNVAIDGKIVFGPGTTNYLSRQNLGGISDIQITSPAGGLSITNTASGSGLTFRPSGSSAYIQPYGVLSNTVINSPLVSGTHYPGNTNAVLGQFTTEYTWKDIFVKRLIAAVGYVNGLSDSYATFRHTGTNGSAIFNSFAEGDAGPARDFLFSSNGITVAKISMNSGYDGSGTHALTDDGTFKSVVSLVGTTINATDGTVPVRGNATTFTNSPIRVTAAGSVEISGVGTNSMSDLYVTNAIAGGSTLSLSAKTNLIGDNGTTITYNGAALSVRGGNFWGAGFIDPTQYRITNIYMTNVAAGNVDLWPVPSGYRAYIIGGLASTTNNNNEYRAAVKTNGVYYWLSGAATGTAVTTNSSAGIILTRFVYDGNETIAYSNKLTGATFGVSIAYWTNTVTGPKTAKWLGMTSGVTNTFYTCPTGYTATRLDTSLDNGGIVILKNAFETGITHTLFYIPNGQAANATTMMFQNPSVTVGTTSFAVPALNGGDAVAASTSSNNANQNIWMTVLEYLTP